MPEVLIGGQRDPTILAWIAGARMRWMQVDARPLSG
jgi:hypothetical protein